MDHYSPAESNCESHHGGEPCVVNIPRAARRNQNFRSVLWTGHHLQMTLMCIPARGEIGVEAHPDADQFIRVEQGEALACTGKSRDKLDLQCRLGVGDGVFVPCGTWHNIRNTGSCPLKLSSVYAPPQHARGTVHSTKEDAEQEEH